MAIWISKFLGPVILVLAIPMIFAPASLNDVTRKFLEDRPLILISGVLALVAGLAIVNTHNVWSLDWTVIITLFGWALTIGGASRILAPHFVAEVGRSMVGNPKFTMVGGVVWAVLGAFLTTKGYL
jgi:hypothetical protein